jgi:hypothetical protein
MRERGENRVTAVDVGEITVHELALAPLGAAAEVAPHRVDRLQALLFEERRGAAAVLLGTRGPAR